ncbi:hypothetical protein [Acanthopleuribacter pedis]|uniref:Uncharacterized protein n=1 Tax=Acanthopleuribacter pedis TaxID=442870 RepID=A0A8J7Q943_9BACT|nr:hypothetical protein [Acanthopleuribacter pedis]MBO1320866.1 hypothetical protein [Acanthopleuribacter pedis]
MANTKAVVTVIGVGIGLVFVLIQAWQKGQARHVYELQRFPRPIPIPILHTSYTASATWADTAADNRLKILWNPVPVPAAWREERQHFQCIGKVQRNENFAAYVLVYDDRLFIEKDTLIEPMIRGYEYFQKHGKYPDDVFETLKPDHYRKKP